MSTIRGNNEEPTEQELRGKIKEYLAFVDNTLQPQLTDALAKREEIESEIREYRELSQNLKQFQAKTLKTSTLVDLGHELLYCHAKIIDPNHVFVSIGMGFHAELTIQEAILFITRRIEYLQRLKLPPRVDHAREVANHMQTCLEILDSLGQEMKQMNTVN